MKTPAKVYASIPAFLYELERLISLESPFDLKGDESVMGRDVVVRHWRLAPINGSPWVEIFLNDGEVYATVCGRTRKCLSPGEAMAELDIECRSELEEAGIFS